MPQFPSPSLDDRSSIADSHENTPLMKLFMTGQRRTANVGMQLICQFGPNELPADHCGA